MAGALPFPSIFGELIPTKQQNNKNEANWMKQTDLISGDGDESDSHC